MVPTMIHDPNHPETNQPLLPLRSSSSPPTDVGCDEDDFPRIVEPPPPPPPPVYIPQHVVINHFALVGLTLDEARTLINFIFMQDQ
jgi:hypothetical protein